MLSSGLAEIPQVSTTLKVSHQKLDESQATTTQLQSISQIKQRREMPKKQLKVKILGGYMPTAEKNQYMFAKR